MLTSSICKNGFTSFVVLAITLSSAAHSLECQNPTPVWEDNFDGTSLDTSKWEVMLGDGCSYGICGWGNNELQSYQAENNTVNNGVLTITAKKQRVQSKSYTSGRIRTANMPNGGEWTNGRFEARIKLPNGTGMWPAFWMLPTNPSVGWPESGEIDILEATGQADMFAFGTIHYGQPWPNNEWTSGRVLKQPDTWSADFHTYAVEWEPNEMRWYIDDLLYSTKTPSDLSDPTFWTFENFQYHFLLNMAVGGSIGGPVDDSMLPQTMEVDYVRVYNQAQPSLRGAHLVEPSAIESYSIIDERGTGSSYTWNVPGDATIISGANSDTVTIQWGSNGGELTAGVSNSCGNRTLALEVYVAPSLSEEITLENFDGSNQFTYTQVTGELIASVNPSTNNPINNSPTAGHYTRNAAELYDVIIGTTNGVPDVAPFIQGNKAFYMDIYTANAPIGTEVIIQLEDNTVATSANYPLGRHSKYVAHIEVQNAWQRLKFKLEDRLDGTTSDFDVNSMVILIAPNTNSGDTYYLDNLAIYSDSGTPAAATSINIEGISTGTASAGKGKKYAQAIVTVVNNLGAPTAGATVTGDFSGTITESGVTGTTQADGTVTLLSTASASGGVDVTFTATSLCHETLSGFGSCP